MSQAQLFPSTSPSVALCHGRPATTSLEVARFFGKRHDAVLRDIRNLIANTQKSFHDHSFVEMLETVEIGNGATRQSIVFIIYRDGFMLLAMGYTGKKAMQIMLAYIQAINAMEAQLAGRKALPGPVESVLQRIYTLPAGEYEKATKDERHPIDHARKAWVAAAAANGRVIQHSDSWKIIRGHFGNITRIDDLPAAWVKDAVRFCQEMLAHETMVKIREERELEERAECRATAALPAPTPQQPAQPPLPVSIAQLDIAGIETAMEEATRRQLAYSEAVFNLMNKVRAPFWEREGRQASPALKGLMQAMARGLGDMQMTAAHAHNAVIASAVIAVEGCKLLADEGGVMNTQPVAITTNPSIHRGQE